MNPGTIDADRRLRGPYSLAAGLLDLLLPEASGELIAAYDIEIRTAAPHLASQVPPRRSSLAERLPQAQRILIPGARHTLRIANGLAEFVRDHLAGRTLELTVDNLGEADPTDTEFVEVLRRRVPSLTIVPGATAPHDGPLVADFDRFRDEGFHHAMAEAGLLALDGLTHDDDPERWWLLLHRTAGALEAIEREEEAYALYQLARREGTEPKNRATVACSLAMLLVRHHDPAKREPDEALAWINEAITITSLLPDRRERAFHLGFDLNAKALVQVRRGRFAEALELVREAIELAEADEHPIHRLVLHANRAQLMAMSGRVEEALADYTRAVEADPGYPDYYLDRGNLLHKLGRTAEALADYEAVMRVSPPFPEPYYNRAEIRFAEGDLKGALSDLDYALELDPDFSAAYVNRSGLLAALGEWDRARRDVEHGLARDPANPYLLCVLGQVESGVANYDQARIAFRAALEIKPDLVAAWAGRAELAFTLGDPKAAVAELTQAIELAELEETAELLFNRAVAARACGMGDEARSDLLRAAELAPDDAEIRRALAEE